MSGEPSTMEFYYPTNSNSHYPKKKKLKFRKITKTRNTIKHQREQERVIGLTTDNVEHHSLTHDPCKACCISSTSKRT